MANGWAPDGAVQDQIEDSIKDMLQAARARMPAGEGLDFCEDCGEPIPAARRQAEEQAVAKLRERITMLIRNRLGGGYGKGEGLKWEVTLQFSADKGKVRHGHHS